MKRLVALRCFSYGTLAVALAGCAHTTLPVSREAPRDHPQTSHASRLWPTRCAQVGSRVVCQFQPGRAIRELSQDAKAVVTRFGGGAFVLDRDGELHRFNRQGQATGSLGAGAVGLARADRFICHLSDDGEVRCFFDRPSDLVCPETTELEPGEVVDRAVGAQLLGLQDSAALLVTDTGGQRRAYALRLSCEAHCLQLSCDSAPYCMDPCPRTDRSRVFARLSSAWDDLFSNLQPAQGTHL